MDANECKSYLLGLVFYKYLSDKMLFFVTQTMQEPTDDLTVALERYRTYYQDEDMHQALIDVLNGKRRIYV